MTPCSACGRIESPLVGGICPACLASPRGPIATARSASPLPRTVSEHPSSHSQPITLPSTFLAFGIALEFVGLAITLVGTASISRATSPLQLVGSLAGLALVLAGSILLSVGTIRWAIWPLIERRDRD
jgi:hypothetical protein